MTISIGITGRSIQVSLEEYLRMTDEDFQDIIAHEQGYVLNHPFTESCLIDLTSEDIEDEDEIVDDGLFSLNEISEMLSNDSFGDC
jgi:hypothetical protein